MVPALLQVKSVSRETDAHTARYVFHVNHLRIAPDHVSRESFPDAELGKDHTQKLLDIDCPRNAAERIARETQMFGF